MRYLVVLFTTLVLAAAPARAMDGVVSDTGDAVTVEDGTVFNEGDTVTVYDADGGAHDMQVVGVTDGDDSVSVDVVDNDTGDSKTIDFVK
jgi:hypothetical protein